MTDWKDLRKELLSDPGVKKEYDRLAPRYAVISELIAARNKRGLTQAELAKRMGTKQSAIARLEGGSVNPTIDFLGKLARVLGVTFSVQLR
jgi:ribosome-binding protein aMBF1 (putative translation factor)